MWPEVIANQADVSPADWGGMREKLVRYDPSLTPQAGSTAQAI
jgi:hypothetical protein